MSVIRVLFGFLIACAVGTAVASITHTQFIIAQMVGLGVEISLAERVSWTLADLRGLNDFTAASELMPILVTIALGAGFLVAAVLTRLFGGLRGAVFFVSGYCAFVALFFTLNTVLGVSAIAGTRGMIPLLIHGGAGALAGLVFVLLTPPRQKRAAP